MKGLLVKDLCLIKNQGNSVLVMAACGLVMTFTMAPPMAVGYVTALGLMLVLGTLGYDEFEGGYTYLFTLPVTRRDYVIEKYVLCLLGSLAGAVFGLVLCLAAAAFKGEAGTLSLPDLFIMAVLVLCVINMAMAGIMIPVRLKYGSEKSRIILFGIFAVIAAGSFLLASPGALFHGRLAEGLASLGTRISGGTALLFIVPAAAVVLLLSEQISERIMEKKEY